MELLLPSGHLTVFDEQDHELISKYRWRIKKTQRGGMYVVTHIVRDNGMKTTESMHRIIIGAKPGQYVDHRDKNGLNNRRYNLRPCTQSQNNGNSKIRSDNTSHYKGVYLHKASGLWHAKVVYLGKVHSLKYFYDPWEAAQAYNEAAKQLFGEFATLNSKAVT